MYGTVCGKVIRRKNKTGYSYNFLIVKNRRNPMHGKPEYQVVWNFGTIRESELTTNANSFWKGFEKIVANLVNDGKIYRNCGSEIKRKFEKYIPTSVALIALPASAPIKNSNPTVAERVQNRFKNFL